MVINPLVSRDAQLMLQALTALGATVEQLPAEPGTGEPAVKISGLHYPGSGPETASVDCGLAGTVMRFMPTVAAITGVKTHFDGDPAARARPMSASLEGLRALGVDISEDAEPGRLPFTVHAPAGVTGGAVTIDASDSSQFVSGLLLSAARFSEGLTLRHDGAQVPSMEHIEMTLKVLEEVGVRAWSPAPFTWQVEPGGVSAFTARVEPDLSNAGPFLCAAAVTGGRVSIPGWPLESTQIGRRWVSLLEAFGCRTSLTPDQGPASAGASSATLTVEGPETLHSPGVIDGTAELTPTVAALAALCPEETVFTGVQHLRGHETDRIAALVTEIQRLGGQARETEDGFIVSSPITHGGVVHSYADHRMATFGAVLGLAQSGVLVEDIECTSKTMPDFSQRWESMLR